ncbi:DUF3306 domain-containing protein [Alphaproteobacteria bacterium LSUCC0684]
MSEKSRLSRWAERKSRIKKGEHLADDSPEANDEIDPAAASIDAADDADAALTDDELLARHELPDPATIDDENTLEKFLDAGIPDRLRQLALRRLWRLNPLFGVVDEMVEYGEDYTDAATVIEGMQTAYQVGKGYLRKAEDILKEDAGGENAPAEVPEEDREPSNEIGNEQVDATDEDPAVDETGHGKDDASDEAAHPDSSPVADHVLKDAATSPAAVPPGQGGHPPATRQDTFPEKTSGPGKTASLRPRRQVFRKQ